MTTRAAALVAVLAGTDCDAAERAAPRSHRARPASGTVRMSEKANPAAVLSGGSGHAYTTTFRYRTGPRTKVVGVIVVTAPSAAGARAVWAQSVAVARPGSSGTVRLPTLGDEQVAVLHGRVALDEVAAVIWVRRRTAVWQVQVSSLRSPFGISRAEAVAELTRYSVAPKRCVGAG